MNLHILRHYSNNILNSGPPWCQSMFGFESKMGDLKKCQQSKIYICESIIKKYCTFKMKEKSTQTKEITMLREQLINVDPSIAKIFKKCGLLPADNTHYYNIAYEIRIKNEVFRSLSSKISKSIDCFVRMKDETIGAIEIFVRNGRKTCVLLKKYEVSNKKYHFNEVKLKTPIEHQLYFCDDIYEKLIYLKYGR